MSKARSKNMKEREVFAKRYEKFSKNSEMRALFDDLQKQSLEVCNSSNWGYTNKPDFRIASETVSIIALVPMLRPPCIKVELRVDKQYPTSLIKKLTSLDVTDTTLNPGTTWLIFRITSPTQISDAVHLVGAVYNIWAGAPQSRDTSLHGNEVSSIPSNIYNGDKDNISLSGLTDSKEASSKGDIQWVPVPYPDEIDAKNTYTEGAVKQVLINRYERDIEARNKCIQHYGPCCQVCGFDFAKTYGSIGSGFIHVHHIKPISDLGKDYDIDPKTDLQPVCPNCHSMLHKRNPPLSIEELRQIIGKDK